MVEYHPRGINVDSHAQIKVRFGLPGHDAVQHVDAFDVGCKERLARFRVGEVCLYAVDVCLAGLGSPWGWWFEDVSKYER